MADARFQGLALRHLGVAVLALGAVAIPSIAADTATGKPVTFAKDISPIFQAKCEECHHKGTSAPMSLATYEETRPWAKAIKERVVSRQMPPWHLDKTVGIQHFANDRSLSDAQIATIVKWVDGGSPLGDKKDLPAAKVWPTDEGWQLAKVYGQPDLVISSAPYTMPAQGQDVWWKPITEIPLTEARWVRGVEIRPSTVAGRKITHHALANLEQVEPPSADGAPAFGGAGMLMEWSIGKQYDQYRPNTGKLLVPGAKIRWEMHYHAAGEEIRDHTELAIYLYPKGEVPKYRTRLQLFGATPGNQLDIPPNSMKETHATHTLTQPARLENFQAHMHLRGKLMTMEAKLPDGTTRILSSVNNFNFNWMNNYIYTDDDAPVLPKGTVLTITAIHDNTAANKNNPDPNQWVGYGDRTVDEMAHAWVNVTNITQEDYDAYVAKHKNDAPAATAAVR